MAGAVGRGLVAWGHLVTAKGESAESTGLPGTGVVLHTKFAAYLGWSQPFLHRLISGLEAEMPGAVLCHRRENRERFPLPRFVCSSSQALLRPAGASILAEVLRREWNPWLIHAHFGWSGTRSLLLRQCLNVPLVTTFGGRDLGSDLHASQHRPLYRRLLDASDLCICVSDTLAAVLAGEGVEEARIRVLRRGTDVDLFDIHERSDRVVSEPLRILMVGRLVEKKAHRDALEALGQLKREGVSALLRIVGSGDAAPLRAQAEALGLSPVLQVEAPTDTRGVLDHYRWADLLLHCSRTGQDGDVEGIPNVVVEAAATGLPIVGTRHGGIPEVVDDGETGALVPEADPSALAAALHRLAVNPESRRALGAAGAKRVRNDLDLDAQVEAHRKAYEQLRGITPRAQPLPRAFTQESLLAIAPAIDADLLNASRALRHRWVPARPLPSRAVPERGQQPAFVSPVPATNGNAISSASGSTSARERLRQFGAAWAERPILGLPMQAYRFVRRRWVAAAQRREDVHAWQQIEAGHRPDAAALKGAVLRGVVKEGPAGDSP